MTASNQKDEVAGNGQLQTSGACDQVQSYEHLQANSVYDPTEDSI